MQKTRKLNKNFSSFKSAFWSLENADLNEFDADLCRPVSNPIFLYFLYFLFFIFFYIFLYIFIIFLLYFYIF